MERATNYKEKNAGKQLGRWKCTYKFAYTQSQCLLILEKKLWADLVIQYAKCDARCVSFHMFPKIKTRKNHFVRIEITSNLRIYLTLWRSLTKLCTFNDEVSCNFTDGLSLLSTSTTTTTIISNEFWLTSAKPMLKQTK